MIAVIAMATLVPFSYFSHFSADAYCIGVWHVLVYHTFSLFLLSFYDELPKDKNNLSFHLNTRHFLFNLVLHHKMATITNEYNKRNKYCISKDTDCSKLYIEQTSSLCLGLFFLYLFLLK